MCSRAPPRPYSHPMTACLKYFSKRAIWFLPSFDRNFTVIQLEFKKIFGTAVFYRKSKNPNNQIFQKKISKFSNRKNFKIFQKKKFQNFQKKKFPKFPRKKNSKFFNKKVSKVSKKNQNFPTKKFFKMQG